jgi:hypothetical protein
LINPPSDSRPVTIGRQEFDAALFQDGDPKNVRIIIDALAKAHGIPTGHGTQA